MPAQAVQPVFVGLGSNIRPREHVPQALARLAERFGALRVSAVYQCPAVGFDGHDFVNLVVAFDTDESAHALQATLRAVEHACGRVRGARNKSRTMDIDLLLYGDAVIADERLRVPRADILEYAFVLRPLAELVPELRHPQLGRTYAELWAAFDASDQPLTEITIDGTDSYPT